MKKIAFLITLAPCLLSMAPSQAIDTKLLKPAERLMLKNIETKMEMVEKNLSAKGGDSLRELLLMNVLYIETGLQKRILSTKGAIASLKKRIASYQEHGSEWFEDGYDYEMEYLEKKLEKKMEQLAALEEIHSYLQELMMTLQV